MCCGFPPDLALREPAGPGVAVDDDDDDDDSLIVAVIWYDNSIKLNIAIHIWTKVGLTCPLDMTILPRLYPTGPTLSWNLSQNCLSSRDRLSHQNHGR